MKRSWPVFPPAFDPPAAFWRSLHFFHLYRLVIAGLFLLLATVVETTRPFGYLAPTLTLWVTSLYLAAAILFTLIPEFWRPRFNLLLTLEVGVDILALVLLMSANGGSRSGIGYMLLVVLAGAGLVGQGRLTLFYAASASVALLLEQAYRLFSRGADIGDFTHTGFVCIGFFATAITARLLAQRVVANEELARQRGVELSAQLQINQRVIRDMQDGVLVVDAQGEVRQHNPQAASLCAAELPAIPSLADFSPDLALRFNHWKDASTETAEVIRLRHNGRLIRVRYLPPAEGEAALLYLEDMAAVQERAQQIKLAALGRLTANMAHEIRNPLTAISHASELLAEEASGEVQSRLSRIIVDNTLRLNRLVTEVLELGKRDQAHPDAVGLADFLPGFLEEMALIEPRATVALALDVAPGASIRFDRGHLTRVLLNLAGNALRYCSGEPRSVRIWAAPSSYAGRTEIHVQDDGSGVPEALRNQIFEPFFTTRATGTGLGLYIARELCDANGAVLTLEEGGSGAHFKILGENEA